jgi:hypothetical protein
MKKLISLAVIFLFIVLAFAPSINANVRKEDLVEFTTEVCGQNGGKQTVKLAQQQADEVEALFNSIREQLNATESREEAEEIFKDAVVELDKYGLLGGLSVKQAQRLVTSWYQKSRIMKISERMIGKFQTNNSNYLCLIVGTTNGTNFDSQIELLFGRITVLLGLVGPILFDKFPLYMFFIMGYFFMDFFDSFNPVAIASRINIGGEMGGGWIPEFVEFYANGWIVTTGLLGVRRYNGELIGTLPLYGSAILSNGFIYKFNPGIIGFTGLQIYYSIQDKHFYLGSALATGIE